LTSAAALPLRPPSPEQARFPALLAGLPRAAVHEIAPARPGDGPAASGFAAALAVFWAGKGFPVVWAREAAVRAEEGELYPPGLAQFGLDLSRLMIVDAQKRPDALWAAEEALKTPGAVAIVEIGARGSALDLAATRRLALAAESHRATALLIDHSRARAPSAAWTRWAIAAAASAAPDKEVGPPAFAAQLLRMRNALGGRSWIVEWRSDETVFRETMGGDLAQPALHRSAGPARRRAG
jgi:protein ImuA